MFLRARSVIRQDDPLPIEVVTLPRRGDSSVARYSAIPGVMEYIIPDGVPTPWQMIPWRPGSHWMASAGPEDADRWILSFPEPQLGRHVIQMKMKDRNLQWADKPLGMDMPRELDLGQAYFTVAPRESDPLVPVNDPKLVDQVESCIKLHDLLRWRDTGNLSIFVDAHRPPVDLAFHVSVEAAGRKWDAEDIFVKKGEEINESYSGLGVDNAKDMPAKGLTFIFRADPDVARRSVGGNEYWAGDVRIENVSIDRDDYLNDQSSTR